MCLLRVTYGVAGTSSEPGSVYLPTVPSVKYAGCSTNIFLPQHGVRFWGDKHVFSVLDDSNLFSPENTLFGKGAESNYLFYTGCGKSSWTGKWQKGVDTYLPMLDIIS